MSDRWGDSRRDRDQLDAWILREPPDDAWSYDYVESDADDSDQWIAYSDNPEPFPTQTESTDQ